MLSEFRFLFYLLRRASGQALTLWAATQFSSKIAVCGRVNHDIEANRIAFILAVFVANAIYELFQIVTAPDLSLPCEGSAPMLDLERDK